MRILEEFWYGNIEPAEYDTTACREYNEVLRLITRKNSFPGTRMLSVNIKPWPSACCFRAALS